MRTSLTRDPRVSVIAQAIGIKSNQDHRFAIGIIFDFWAYAGEMSSDGFMPHTTPDFLDNTIRCKGITKAMASVGWVQIEANGVRCLEWESYNSRCAKARVQTAKRVAKHRAKRNSESITPSVTSPLPTGQDRRGEKDTYSAPPEIPVAKATESVCDSPDELHGQAEAFFGGGASHADGPVIGDIVRPTSQPNSSSRYLAKQIFAHWPNKTEIVSAHTAIGKAIEMSRADGVADPVERLTAIAKHAGMVLGKHAPKASFFFGTGACFDAPESWMSRLSKEARAECEPRLNAAKPGTKPPPADQRAGLWERFLKSFPSCAGMDPQDPKLDSKWILVADAVSKSSQAAAEPVAPK
jgi:hypothetical protein